MHTVTQATNECPSSELRQRSNELTYDEKIADVLMSRGTGPHSIVSRSSATLATIVQALEGDPDRTVSEAMLCDLLETSSLLGVVAEELEMRSSERLADPELTLALGFAPVAPRVRSMLQALTASGERRTRFEWVGLAAQLTSLLGEGQASADSSDADDGDA